MDGPPSNENLINKSIYLVEKKKVLSRNEGSKERKEMKQKKKRKEERVRKESLQKNSLEYIFLQLTFCSV